MDILENYQQEESIKEPESTNYSFAVIGKVYEDGVSLIFPGSEEPSEKHYKANMYCKFKAGQRVYIAKDSGTYIALFPVGKPGSEPVEADTATNAQNAINAENAINANNAVNAETATNAQNATNATNAENATSSKETEKLKYYRTIELTGAVKGSGSFNGSQNLSISTSFGSGTVNRATTADRWTNSRTLTLNGDVSGSASFNGSSNISINVDVKSHSGSTLGFFNTSPVSKRGVSNLTSTPTLNNLKDKLNELIDDLQSYGLIGS